MPKMKTHRASAKRFRTTGGKGKATSFMRRRATQGHFNAREDGSTMRLKRGDTALTGAQVKRVKKLLPYSIKRNQS